MEETTALSDLQLVQRIKDNACSDSFNELARRHSNLFYKVCQSYIKTLNSLGYCPTDIFEERDMVLFEAVQKFNPEKGTQFSTWLGNYTRYFCLNKINEAKHMPEVASAEEIEAVFNDESIKAFEDQKPEVAMDNVFDALKTTNDPRITAIFKLRYDPFARKKRTWAKIAEELKLTVQTTIQLHKKGLHFLRTQLASESLDIYA